MDRIPIPLFVKQLGHQVFAYFLNIDEHQAKDLLDGSLELDRAREEVLLGFVERCQQIRAAKLDSQGDHHYSLISGLSFLIKDGKHVFSICRRDFGGSQPTLDDSDKLISLFSSLAIDVYPIFLLHLSTPYPPFLTLFTTVPASPQLAERYQDLLEAVIDDSQIGKIFRNEEGTARQDTVEFATSTGRGGSIQLNGFPEIVVLKAFELCKVRNDISLEGFLRSISTVIQLFRELGDGKTIDVPVCIGFHNIGIVDSKELATELGTLRAYDPGIYSLLANDARPSILGGTNDVLGFILETKTNYRILFHKSLTDLGTTEFERTYATLKDREKQLSLAFALAIDRTPPIGLTAAWTFVFDPIVMVANVSMKIAAFSPFNHYLLDAKGSEQLVNWCEKVKKQNNTHLNIAIHRVVSCISDRLDPVDGFIDAVMAWENLFGNGPELKFRISMAIAKLLEDNLEGRRELQKVAAKLYDRRSEIVHGSKTVAYQEAAAMRDDALRIALRCLRVLYGSRPELINESDRAKQILLN